MNLLHPLVHPGLSPAHSVDGDPTLEGYHVAAFGLSQDDPLTAVAAGEGFRTDLFSSDYRK